MSSIPYFLAARGYKAPHPDRPNFLVHPDQGKLPYYPITLIPGKHMNDGDCDIAVSRAAFEAGQHAGIST